MILKKLLGTVLLLTITITSFSQHRRGSQVNFKDSPKKESDLFNVGVTNRKFEVGVTGGYQFGGNFYSYNYGL